MLFRSEHRNLVRFARENVNHFRANPIRATRQKNNVPLAPHKAPHRLIGLPTVVPNEAVERPVGRLDRDEREEDRQPSRRPQVVDEPYRRASEGSRLEV